MQQKPQGDHEQARLFALKELELLESNAERLFDAIAELAAQLCDAPIAAIALVDQERHWFKSSFGVTLTHSPREVALCAHTLEQSAVMEVPDATADPRYSETALVSGAPGIRFYAGIALRSVERQLVGCLCVMDGTARRLSPAQRAALETLADVLGTVVEVRQLQTLLTRSRTRAEHLGTLLDQSANEIYLFDAQSMRIAYANEGACRNTQYSAQELRQLSPIQLQPSTKLSEFEAAMAQLTGGTRSSVVLESECTRKDGSSYPVQVRLQLHGAPGSNAVLAVVTDISERVQAQRELTLSHERLRDITDHVPALIAYIDRSLRYRFFNNAYHQWFGVGKKLALGMHMEEVLGEVYPRALPYVQRCLAGERVSFEVGGVRQAGLPEHAVIHYLPHIVDGEVAGFYVLVLDISVQKRAEEALFQEKELLAVTLHSIGDAVITTDVEGRVTYMNPLAEGLTGWSNADATGKLLPDVLFLADGTTKVRTPDPVMVALTTNSPSGMAINTVLLRSDGAEIPVEDSAAPIHDRQGNVIGGVLVFRDMSETRAMALKMTHLAQHDLLTHLPNRLLLNDRVQQALGLAARRGKRVALMFLDLDRFKHVNDSLGHAIGDKLLQSVAQRLLGCVRATDTVCRQGGDEFVVLLSEIEHGQQAARVADKLLRTVSLPYSIDGHELHISLSLGISIYPDDAQDPESLSKNADTAMYHAKEQGRGNYQFFTAELNRRAQERATLERSMRRGLRRGEFMLHYQPKVCLASGNVIGAEALLRWQHPERGLIPPEQFIAVAEEAGFIVRLGQWVMNSVCEQLASWRSAGLQPLPIAINVSGMQLRERSFVEDVRLACSGFSVPPGLVELELTESVLMHERDATGDLLGALKRMGLRLSIDDFGTGYSSLSYLKRFPIDALKIDRSFVRDISTDPDDAAIVSAIISMAKSLKQQVIAEGVETQAQLDFLREHRCDQMQGYLFSRPVTPQVLAQKFFGAR